MGTSYLSIGNCQAEYLADALANYGSSRYLLAATPAFSDYGITRSRQRLVELFGEERAKGLIASGLIIPLPSKQDIAERAADVIICNLFHDRMLITDKQTGTLFASSVTPEFIAQRSPFLDDTFAPFILPDESTPPTHLPASDKDNRIGYLHAFEQYVTTIKAIHPESQIILLNRFSDRNCEDLKPLSWLIGWPELEDAYYTCCERLQKAAGAKILSLEALYEELYTSPDEFTAEAVQLITEKSAYTDAEHTSQRVIEHAAELIATGKLHNAPTFPPALSLNPMEYRKREQLVSDKASWYAFIIYAHIFPKALEDWDTSTLAEHLLSLRLVDFNDIKVLLKTFMPVLTEQSIARILTHYAPLFTPQQRDTLRELVAGAAIARRSLPYAKTILSTIEADEALRFAKLALCERLGGNYTTASTLYQHAIHALTASHEHDQTQHNTLLKELSITLYDSGKIDAATATLKKIVAPPDITHADWGFLKPVPADAICGKNLLIIRTAPWLVCEHLLAQIRAQFTAITLLSGGQAPNKTQADDILPLPDGAFNYAIHKDSLPDILYTTPWDAIVILANDPQAPHTHAEPLKLATSLTGTPTYWYTSLQVFNNYKQSILFRQN